MFKYSSSAMINFKKLFSRLKNEDQKIYLCLSGGGVRAMAFHTGVLKYLAQNEMFNKIDSISSVSAGSLLTGFIFSKNNLYWPEDQSFLNETLPLIKETLLSGDLLKKMKNITFEPNIDSWFNRANRLSACIKEVWGIEQQMGDVFSGPNWIINTTCAETGTRFYFFGRNFIGYRYGRFDSSNIYISDALAMSSALPFYIGPYVLKTGEFNWDYSLDDVAPDEDNIQEKFEKIHILDGGIYDNTGLEAFLAMGKGFRKADYKSGLFILSDASEVLREQNSSDWLEISSSGRSKKIMANQVRSLRMRNFHGYLERGDISGYYLRLGDNYFDRQLVRGQLSSGWSNDSIIDSKVGKHVSQLETGLQPLSERDFDGLVSYGYELLRLKKRIFP